MVVNCPQNPPASRTAPKNVQAPAQWGTRVHLPYRLGPQGHSVALPDLGLNGFPKRNALTTTSHCLPSILDREARPTSTPRMTYPPPAPPQPTPSVLRKSNALTRAGYSLSLGGHRILGCALAALAIDESLFPRFAISSEMVKAAFPALQNQNAYAALMRKTCSDAVGMRVTLLDETFLNIGVVPLFSRLDFIDGVFFISFSADIAPQVTELTRNFTSYTLEDVAQFTSEHQFRVHEIARSFLYQGSKEIPIEHLRRALGIAEDEYASAGHLMARVINPSVARINEKTHLRVSAEPLKHSSSHKIYAVRFTVQQARARVLTTEDRRLVTTLQEMRVSSARALEIVTHYEAAEVEAAITSVKQRVADGGVLNPAGLLVTKICGTTRAATSLEALQPQWTSQVRSAMQLYKAASTDERRRIDRGFKQWAAYPWQMFTYIDEFETTGVDDPFIAQLLALYIHKHHHPGAPIKSVSRRPERSPLAAERAIAQAVEAGQVELFS